MSNIRYILLCIDLTYLCDIICPSKVISVQNKSHLSYINLKFALFNNSKTYFKCYSCSSLELEYITISFMYTITKSRRKS